MQSGSSRAKRRLKSGEVVEGTVIQVSGDSVFVDVGATTDARLDRAELEDRDGNISVKVGDRLRATVLEAGGDALVLTVAIGKGAAIDASRLQSALESGAPVSGKVLRAVKGGLEIDVGGIRAFCPASQVELGYAAELGAYEGQELELKVIEIREGGRSVVLSRKALLEDQRAALAASMQDQLVPGADLVGTVQSFSKHGVVVDLGGLDGFVHVSELAHRRVENPEDVVNVGDSIEVRVLSVEQGDRGLRIKLSMKARIAREASAQAAPEEVLTGTVTGHANHGVFIETPKGEGMIPVRELGLGPGADHRRAFPIGKQVQVVLFQQGGGRQRFSIVGVARVEERRNYREFSSSGAGGGAGLGSLGDVLREKLGLPPAAPEPAPAPKATAEPQSAAAPKPVEPPRATAPEPSAKAAPVKAEPRPDPPGVVRRRR